MIIIQDFSGFFKYRAENRRIVYKRTDSDVQIAILKAFGGLLNGENRYNYYKA